MGEHAAEERSPPAGSTGVVGRTALALRAATARRDSLSVLVGGSLAYLLVYLVTVGDLALSGGTEPSVRLAADLSRAFASTGFFRFDAIAVVSGYGLTVLLSPLNLLVAAALAALVGANLSLSYLGLVQPRACGLEASSGVLAGLPALLSGAACCGPTVLLLVGVQATAGLIGVFQLLVPIAFVLLLAGLLLIGRQVDPRLV